MQDITTTQGIMGLLICLYGTGLTHDILIELKSAWVRDGQNVITYFYSILGSSWLRLV